MSYETLEIRQDESGIVHLDLDRPEKHNALSAQMIGELTDFAKTIGASEEARVIILGAKGKSFCAGGDLGWMKAQIAADRATRMREARKLAEMLQALNNMPTPLIGRVHGDAFGGGVGMMCVCDTVVAVTGSRFGLTETRLGLAPSTISPYVAARMGEGNARRVFMSARLFGAEEAQSLGLVAEVVTPGDLDIAIEVQVAPYLKVAPGAVGRAKALVRSLGPRIDDAVIDATIDHLADCWETEEAKHGIESFLAKTPPRWA